MNNRNKELEKLQAQFEEQLSKLVRCWVLDIDGNLFDVTINDKTRQTLSTSAERELSTSLQGVIVNPLLFDHMDVKEIKAIARKRWQGVFNAMLAVNDRYATLDPNASTPLINLMFLTSATYEEMYFMRIFSQVYGDRLLEPIAPEYHNRFDILEVVNNGTLDKGEFMDFMFKQHWNNSYELTAPDQIRLIDDHIENIASAKKYHFSTIHNPTSEKLRAPHQTYTNEKENVFNTLHNDINAAQQLCDLLEKINSLGGLKKTVKPKPAPQYNPFIDEMSSEEEKPSWDKTAKLNQRSNLALSYDTDDWPVENVNVSDVSSNRTISPTTSQSSSTGGDSRLFSRTNTPKLSNAIEDLQLINAIINDIDEDIEPERSLHKKENKPGVAFIDSLKNELEKVLSVDGGMKLNANFEETINNILTLVNKFDTKNISDTSVSFKTARELKEALLEYNKGNNDKLLLIASKRMINGKW